MTFPPGNSFPKCDPAAWQHCRWRRGFQPAHSRLRRRQTSTCFARLVGLGLTEQHLEATLSETNPNTNAIGFRQVTVDINVSGLLLASGRKSGDVYKKFGITTEAWCGPPGTA
jgi:hypothetical protein